MTAFPQLVRCFEAQWRGLTEYERGAASIHHIIFHVGQYQAPLWIVRHNGAELCLMGIKEDML